jgi:hypothetical protein
LGGVLNPNAEKLTSLNLIKPITVDKIEKFWGLPLFNRAIPKMAWFGGLFILGRKVCF